MLRASRMVSQEANGGEGSNEHALAGGHRVGVAPVRKGGKNSRLVPLWDQTRVWDPGD